MIRTRKSSSYKTGYSIFLGFILRQHIRDLELMKSIVKYLNCGSTSFDREACEYHVYKTSDVTEKIIPFFEVHSLQSSKLLDFNDAPLFFSFLFYFYFIILLKKKEGPVKLHQLLEPRDI
jgi:hypothetical protein